MVVLSDEDIFWFDISMHEIVLMQIIDSLTNVPEIPFDKWLTKLSITKLDLLVE